MRACVVAGAWRPSHGRVDCEAHQYDARVIDGLAHAIDVMCLDTDASRSQISDQDMLAMAKQ